MEKMNISSYAQEVAAALMVIHRAIIRKQTMLAGFDKLSFMQGVILSLLYEKKQLKMHEVAQAMNFTLPAATKTIKKLHQLRMVKRIYDKKDRRLVYVSLTPQGARVAKKMGAVKEKMISLVFSKLSDKERAQYLKIIRKLKKAMENEL